MTLLSRVRTHSSPVEMEEFITNSASPDNRASPQQRRAAMLEVYGSKKWNGDGFCMCSHAQSGNASRRAAVATL